MGAGVVVDVLGLGSLFSVGFSSPPPQAAKAKLSKMPTLKVPCAKRPKAAMERGVNYNGDIVKNPAKARFALDGDVLKVAVETMLPEKRQLGDGWAGNEAVELAFMASDGATADIIVFRGFTSGNFEAFKLVN